MLLRSSLLAVVIIDSFGIVERLSASVLVV